MDEYRGFWVAGWGMGVNNWTNGDGDGDGLEGDGSGNGADRAGVGDWDRVCAGQSAFDHIEG